MESAPTGGRAKFSAARGRSRRRGVPGTISGLRAGPYGPVGLRNAPAGAVQASSPTQVCNYTRAAVFRVAVHPDIGCRGGFHIRPWAFAPPRVPGTMQASSPTQVCNYIRAAVFRVAVHPAIGCRGGFHIRPRTFAPPRAGPILNRPLQAAGQSRSHPRVLAAARGTAGWGIPPYGRPGGCGHPGWSNA